MKSVRVLAALAIAMVLGAAIAGAQSGTDAAAKSDKMSEKSMKGDMTATLEAKERAMQEAFKAKDADTMMGMIDPNGWMADPMGFAPVSKIPEMIKQYDVQGYTMSDVKSQMIDKDACILTYTFTGQATMNGQPLPSGPFFCSTIWAKRGKEWKAVYHQETLAMSAMMPPGATSESK